MKLFAAYIVYLSIPIFIILQALENRKNNIYKQILMFSNRALTNNIRIDVSNVSFRPNIKHNKTLDPIVHEEFMINQSYRTLITGHILFIKWIKWIKGIYLILVVLSLLVLLF